MKGDFRHQKLNPVLMIMRTGPLAQAPAAKQMAQAQLTGIGHYIWWLAE